MLPGQGVFEPVFLKENYRSNNKILSLNMQEKTPKVSVCIVTYNQEKYIRQCLQSIVDQETDFDFEVIVGDDCSTDGTRSIINHFESAYPKLVRLIQQEKNTGGMQNYLTVHQAAAGDYVCHVDGDDWVRPGKLQKQSRYLDENNECTLVAHRMATWAAEKQVATTRNNPERIDLSLLLRHHPMFLNSSIMYRKHQLASIFQSDKKFIDFYVYISAAQRGGIGFINEVLGDYRRNIGISTVRNLTPYIQAAINLAAESTGETSAVIRCRSRSYLSYSIAALCENNNNEFQKKLSESIKADKHWILPKLVFLASYMPKTLRSLILIYKSRPQS